MRKLELLNVNGELYEVIRKFPYTKFKTTISSEDATILKEHYGDFSTNLEHQYELKLTNNLIDKLFYSQYYNRCIGGEYGHEKFCIC